jgi:hypothetical protein
VSWNVARLQCARHTAACTAREGNIRSRWARRSGISKPHGVATKRLDSVGRDAIGSPPYRDHMPTNELDTLVGGVPPRQMDLLTTVSGHDISDSNARPVICECGVRQPADWTGTPNQRRETHLQAAWPDVRRADGETAETFLARLSDLYVAASMLEQGIDEAQGLDRPIPPGGEYPVISEESMTASDLVEVIERQMNALQHRLLQTTWVGSSLCSHAATVASRRRRGNQRRTN